MPDAPIVEPPPTFFERLPSPLTDTILMRLYCFAKLPLIAFCQPQIRSIDEQGVEIVIPLSRRTKNHLGSMYFGALAVGADLAGAYLAIRHIKLKKLPISFVFKDLSAQFLRRPEGDVCFSCHQGAAIQRSLSEAMHSGERVNIPLEVIATDANSSDGKIVASFQLTLSVKRKSSAA